MAKRDRQEPADSILDPDQICICSCGVIVIFFVLGEGDLIRWDPGWVQRRWVRSLWPRQLLDAHGYGWGMGELHICCHEGNRPIDVIGGRLAGDGTDEGPVGQGGVL